MTVGNLILIIIGILWIASLLYAITKEHDPDSGWTTWLILHIIVAFLTVLLFLFKFIGAHWNYQIL